MVSLKLSCISVLWSLYGSFLRGCCISRSATCPPLSHPIRITQHPCITCEVYQPQRYVLCSLVGYSKSWEVCSQLGQSEGYHDLSMRQELMAFALTHCPPSAIEALLGVSSSLQTQVGVSETSFIQVQCLPN